MPKVYSKNTWIDEALASAARYDILENGGGAFKSNMQINLATSVVQAGTNVDATRMNNIESGIDNLDNQLVPYTTGGTSTAFTITTPNAPALVTGEVWRVIFNATAGTTPTLNRDSKGAKSLKYYNAAGTKTACGAATIKSGMIVHVIYDGTDYVVLNIAVRTDHTELTSIGSNTHAQIDTYLSNLIQGWVADANTWTYSSADSPTFVISINADMTNILQAGMRIKLTQTTAKYFIVTAVGTFSAGATLVTVYGGTDYTLANATITSPYYSCAPAPFGFPTSPAKWTVSASDTNSCLKTSPASGTYYGDTGLTSTGLSVAIPIGVWYVSLEYLLQCTATVTGSYRGSFSTSASSESDSEFSTSVTIITTGTNRLQIKKDKLLTLAAKTTYYFVCQVGQASQTNVGFLGNSIPTTVKCVCAYL